MNTSKTDLAEITIVIIMCGLFLVVFVPSLSNIFLYSDDYYYLFPRVGDLRFGELLSASREALWDYSMNIGRPILFYGILFYQDFLSDIENAKALRLASLVALTIFYLLLYIHLRKNDFPALLCVMTCVFSFATPTTALLISWLTMHLAVFSMLLSAIAFFALKYGLSVNKRWGLVFLGVLLQYVSLNAYLPAAMVFWVFLIIDVLGKGNRPVGYKETITFASFGVATMIFYLAIGKFFLNFGGSFSLMPIESFVFFIKLNFWSLNFFKLYPNWPIAIIFGCVCVLGVFTLCKGGTNLCEPNQMVKDNVRRIYFSSFTFHNETLRVVIILSFLVFAPLILANYFTPSHRILVSLRVLFAFFLAVGFYRIFKLIPMGEGLRCTVGVTLCVLPMISLYMVNTRELVTPNTLEYSFVEHKVLSISSAPKSICVIKVPPWSRSDGSLTPRGFDLGVLTSAVDRHGLNLVISALYKRDQERGDVENTRVFLSTDHNSSDCVDILAEAVNSSLSMDFPSWLSR